MTSIAAIYCWCFFFNSFATWMKSCWLYASARMLDDNTRRTMCVFESIKKRTYPHYHLERIIYFFLYFSFFPVLFFFLLPRFFSFVLLFIVCILYFYVLTTIEMNTGPGEKNHRSNNLMKSKNKTISHISWAYGHTHTHWRNDWHTVYNSPSFNIHRSIIVTQSMRDRDRQGKEMQSF